MSRRILPLLSLRGLTGAGIRLRLVERNFKISGNRMQVVYTFGPYVKTHRRHVLQQSQYTACRVSTMNGDLRIMTRCLKEGLISKRSVGS